MKTNTETELRELDAWIAEHVFGWMVYKTTRAWQEDGSRTDRCVTVLDQKPRLHFPEYSSDPAAAMQVLEKCAEGIMAAVTLAITPSFATHLGKWTVADGDIVVTAPTLPLAICKFAKLLFSK